MTSTESSARPAVARRRVSTALRRAREAKDWTQTQVANAMDWSLSKVMRIEKGQVAISTNDLKSVLAVLDVTDRREVDGLLADARVSRGQRYATDDLDREHLTPAMIRLFQFEAEASSILHYANIAVPGPLQTREYATAILASLGLDPTTAAARLEARMRRAAKVLERDPAPDYRIIVDESVLHRVVGGHDAMAGQIRYLLDIAGNSSVRIRVVPLVGQNPVFIMSTFMILDLGDSADSILYREVAPDGDETLEAAGEILQHREVFEQLWPTILDESGSRDLMESILRVDLEEAKSA